MRTVMLCEDNEQDRTLIERLVLEYYDGGAAVEAFASSQQAENALAAGLRAQIALLDIMMPGKNGTELAAYMREAGFQGPILFLTASNDFAAESYRVRAHDYLLKPVSKQALWHALDRSEAVLKQSDDSAFLIRSGQGVRCVPFAALIYAEVISHTVYFHLDGGETLSVYASFSEYVPVLLGNSSMARCHKSYIVNMDFIRQMDGKTVVMHGGKQIAISRGYPQFRQKYLHRIFGPEEMR